MQIVRFMSFDNDSVTNHAYYNFANQTVNTVLIDIVGVRLV